MQILLQPPHRLLAKRHQPLLATLAGHPHHALTQIKLIQPQANQFTDAQPGGVQYFQHAAVTQPQTVLGIRCGQQALDVRLAERLGQGSSELGHGDVARRVFTDQLLT